jgi:hypothetical protein
MADQHGRRVTTHLPAEDGAWFDLDAGEWVK